MRIICNTVDESGKLTTLLANKRVAPDETPVTGPAAMGVPAGLHGMTPAVPRATQVNAAIERGRYNNQA